MKVWVFVEGESDRRALETLWEKWRLALRGAGWGIQIIPLENKSKFFKKIGLRADEKLRAEARDLVVGLPDYYPNQPYGGTAYEHKSLDDLLNLQRRLVRDALKSNRPDDFLDRFLPSSLKHDLEMLLLAAGDCLKDHLGTNAALKRWREPVEDQDQEHPPKRIVEDLYRTHVKRAYRDTRDAVAVLGKVKEVRNVIFDSKGRIQCPVFKEMMDWIAEHTGVRGY